jgi:hypothetical protein
LTPLDPTLGPAADTIRRKLLHRLSSLEIRLLHLELGRNPQLRQEVRDVLDRCYPAGTLQERVVGVHSLLARHGLPLLDQLYGLIQFDGFEHRIVGFGAGTQL